MALHLGRVTDPTPYNGPRICCSDTWADPGKQFTPNAWSGMTHPQLVHAMFAYTLATIASFRKAGVLLDMVHFGNEITHVMIWPDRKSPRIGITSPNSMKQGSTGSMNFHGVSTSAEIKVSPGGRFLYPSNGGHNSIAVFSIDLKSGDLTRVQDIPSGGEWPRNFEFDPTGHWIVVTDHNSDNAAVFRIDQESGKLAAVGKPVKAPFRPFSPTFL
jgi:hypothetical protein